MSRIRPIRHHPWNPWLYEAFGRGAGPDVPV